MAAALLLASGCGKKPVATTPAVDSWSRCVFVRHLPAATEGFVWMSQPASVWRGSASTFAPLLADPGLRATWERSAAGRMAGAFLAAPKTTTLLEALAPAVEKEVFVALGAGTGSQLAAMQQIKRLFEAARLRNLFTPVSDQATPAPDEIPLGELPEDLASAAFTEVIVPLPPAMQESLEKFVREAAIPPLLFGAKISPDSALPRLLKEWVASLPEKIPRDQVEAGQHGKFTRLRLPLTLLIPSSVAVHARDMLAANIGDPYAATYIVRDLLSKVTTLGFGFMHGYFVVSIGNESGVPALAERPENSLASTAPMTRLEPLVGDETATLFYADALTVSLAAAPPPVSEYLDAAVESALEFAPAATIDPLREAATSLREQANELFRSRVAAVSGIVQHTGNGWRAELFGGSVAPRLASENAAPLLGSVSSIDILWTEHWAEGYAQRLLDFGGAMAAFASDWVNALGPVFMDKTNLARAEAIMKATGQPLVQFKSNAGKLLGGALGTQTALAVSFDGSMPPPPLLNSAAGKAVLPRLAVAANLRNREALSNGWNNMMAGRADGSAAWPQPVVTKGPDGSDSYEYPAPLGGPDLGVSVTIANNRWILGSSRGFTQSIANIPAATPGENSVQEVEFCTSPLATFASGWSAAIQSEPSLAALTAGIIPKDPSTLAAAAEVLKTPRRFRYRAEWDGGVLHRVIELSHKP